MTKNHNFFIDLAFNLAEKNLGQTGLNPSVGSIVVKNNSVISSGVTSSNGRPHSEYNALKTLKNFYGASLYTTLEPCTHFGKTPPCVNIIIKKKIKKVFYSNNDPDIRTYQKAKKILIAKGIKTKLIKSKKFSRFYDSYFFNKKNELPFITGKIAISKDFFTINKKNKWITNMTSRNIVHLMRYKHDCIISTYKSINQDNSLLNCRIKGLNNNKPDLFIIDLNLKLKKNLLLNSLLRKRNTYIVTLEKNKNKIKIFKGLGFKVLLIKSLNNKKDFNLLSKKIYKLGYSRIFIESGMTFLNYLLKINIINDLYIFKSNKKLGREGQNNDTLKFLKKYISKPISINLNGDKLYNYKF